MTPTNQQAIESRAARTIREIFASGRPLAYIRSSEEQRVARLLDSMGLRVWTWCLTEGMRCNETPAEAGTRDARAALDFIIGHPGEAIFHLKDFHEPLRDSAEVRRRLRDVYQDCLHRQKFVVITSPVRFIPEEVARSLVFLELRPPDRVELVEFLRERLRSRHGELDEAALYETAGALQGLTLDEAGYAIERAFAAGHKLGVDAMPVLLEEKKLLVNRSGYIEFIAESAGLGEVGGLEGLKTWLKERRQLFQMRDQLSSEIVPKGVLIMGIPGCGKSLSVKAIASYLHLPLYRLDMIEIFSGRHGKPEGAFVEGCRMMEDMAPAVLWFDEIEMGITSTETGGEQGRIFAFFLTWMQEKARGLFVAATANRIDLLPAEMIRKGRFDEVFFVDMPVPQEQIQIFEIHLKRRGVDSGRFDLKHLLQFTAGWTGAEIEQCVVSAVTKARIEEREVTEQDLIAIAAKLIPLSRTMKEQISHIRSWAFERAIRASPGERL
ncbi:MAG TPA: AAA family ATPase [Bryobacteraceae bacterium]|nr:AAA family ATPase [Bryobacteraceae bacterium]